MPQLAGDARPTRGDPADPEVLRGAGMADAKMIVEFGAAFVCDAIDEMTESLVRTVRDAL